MLRKRERSDPDNSTDELSPWSPSEDIKQLNLDTSAPRSENRGSPADTVPSRKKSRTNALPSFLVIPSNERVSSPNETKQSSPNEKRRLVEPSEAITSPNSASRHRLSRTESDSQTVGELQKLWFVDDLNKVGKLDPTIELSPSGLSRCLAGKKIAKMGASLSSRVKSPLHDKRHVQKALLVDDIVVTVRLTLHSLHRAGYEADTAVNGRAAVELAKKSQYDVILMDVKLPVMNGVEATKLIRQYEKEQKRKPAIIFGLTGLVSKEDLLAYQAAGMDGCIEKGCIIVEAVRYGIAEKKSNHYPGFLFISPSTCLNLPGFTLDYHSPAPGSTSRRISPKFGEHKSDDEKSEFTLSEHRKSFSPLLNPTNITNHTTTHTIHHEQQSDRKSFPWQEYHVMDDHASTSSDEDRGIGYHSAEEGGGGR